MDACESVKSLLRGFIEDTSDFTEGLIGLDVTRAKKRAMTISKSPTRYNIGLPR